MSSQTIRATEKSDEKPARTASWEVSPSELLGIERETRADQPSVTYGFVDAVKTRGLTPSAPPRLGGSAEFTYRSNTVRPSSTTDPETVGLTEAERQRLDQAAGGYDPTETDTETDVFDDPDIQFTAGTKVLRPIVPIATPTPQIPPQITQPTPAPLAPLAPPGPAPLNNNNPVPNNPPLVNNPQNQDSDTEMGEERSFSPNAFHGRADENGVDWLRHFENYCMYKTYDAPRKLALFRVLLVDHAATWYDSLPQPAAGEAAATTYDNLKAAFETRYKAPVVLKYRSAKELFSRKQSSGESVDLYIEAMRKVGREVQASDTMVMYAIITGLKPAISNFVQQREPDDLSLIHI